MGMFDDVLHDGTCSTCGSAITWWQSKDRDCTLAKLRPRDVFSFYTSCHRCGAWNEYERFTPEVPDGVELIDGALFRRIGTLSPATEPTDGP